MDPAAGPGPAPTRRAVRARAESMLAAARQSVRQRRDRLRRVALWWLAGAVVLFTVLARLRGVPRSTELGAAEVPIQTGLLVIAALGGLIALRAPGAGATMTTVAAFGVGVYAAIEFHPVIAGVALLTLLVPGVMLWLVWQSDHGVTAVALLAVLLGVLLAGGYAAASTFYATYYGATHPESAARLEPSMTRWIWAGGIGVRSAVVVARPDDAAADAALAVWTPEDDAARTFAAVPSGDALRFDITGLEPATTYRYALEVDGVRDAVRVGTLRTPAEGPMSFTVAFASCSRTGGNGAVYDAIAAEDALLFIEYGDFFYGDIGVDDPDRYRGRYDGLLEAPGPQTMLLDTPVVYVWDDHDYATNDSDRTATGAAAAAAVYREYVPSYPLPDSGGRAVYQAFDVGRVRFIVTDSRAGRDPKREPDGPGKSMLGAEQKAWFLAELDAAADAAALVVWVNPVPWIVTPAAGEDSWGGYAHERTEIAGEIARLGLADRLVMVSGDAHMIAVDDGTHSDYAPGGGAGFVVMQAAAIDRIGSLKGGPYTAGPFAGGGQYGTLEVRDDGETVSVVLTGKDWTGRVVLEHGFTVAGVGR